MTGCSIFSMVQ